LILTVNLHRFASQSSIRTSHPDLARGINYFIESTNNNMASQMRAAPIQQSAFRVFCVFRGKKSPRHFGSSRLRGQKN